MNCLIFFQNLQFWVNTFEVYSWSKLLTTNNDFYTETLQEENSDISPGRQTPLYLKQGDVYIYGGESPPEFVTLEHYGGFPSKNASEHHEYTDNALYTYSAFIVGFPFKRDLSNLLAKITREL